MDAKKKNVWLIIYVLTSGIAAVLFFLFISARFAGSFVATDPAASLEYWTPKQRREVSSTFSEVDTRLVVTNVPSFDIIKKEFVMDVVLSFEFNAATVPLKAIGKFSVKSGKIVSLSDPEIRRLPNGRLIASYVARFEFSSPLEYRFFPLDDHMITLTLVNQHLSADEVLFKAAPDALVFSKNIIIPEWKFVGGRAAYGSSQAAGGMSVLAAEMSVPEVAFMFDFNNTSVGRIFTILVPMIVIFLIANLCILIASSIDTTAIFLSLSNLVALLGYRFVLQSVSPSVGYFLLSDFIYLYVLFAALVAIGFSVALFKLKLRLNWMPYILLSLLNIGLAIFSYIVIFCQVPV